MSDVKFVAIEKDGCRDGTYGWSVEVDGKQVIKILGSGDLDMADRSLNPLWEALGVNLEFDWD